MDIRIEDAALIASGSETVASTDLDFDIPEAEALPFTDLMSDLDENQLSAELSNDTSLTAEKPEKIGKPRKELSSTEISALVHALVLAFMLYTLICIVIFFMCVCEKHLEQPEEAAKARAAESLIQPHMFMLY